MEANDAALQHALLSDGVIREVVIRSKIMYKRLVTVVKSYIRNEDENDNT